MRDKTANLLAEAFVDMLGGVKVSATQVLEAMLGAPIHPRFKKLARIGQKAGLAQALKSIPEPDKQTVAKALALIKTYKTMPQQMRSVLKQAVKGLPRARSGPQNKLKQEKEITACAEIATLRADYSNREAIHQVAVKNGVSDRTMYRIWRKNHPKKKNN